MKTLGDQVAELGRPTFDCEKHGRIKIDSMSIARWSDKIWHVFCPRCRAWLSFEVGK